MPHNQNNGRKLKSLMKGEGEPDIHFGTVLNNLLDHKFLTIYGTMKWELTWEIKVVFIPKSKCEQVNSYNS